MTQDCWKKVTAEEWATFERAHPELKGHRVNICEPAAWHLFDAEGRTHGRVWLYEGYPKEREGQVYGWRPNVHELRAAP